MDDKGDGSYEKGVYRGIDLRSEENLESNFIVE